MSFPGTSIDRFDAASLLLIAGTGVRERLCLLFFGASKPVSAFSKSYIHAKHSTMYPQIFSMLHMVTLACFNVVGKPSSIQPVPGGTCLH